MIVVTGAAGFIGSCFVKKLNDEGFTDIVVVDDFSQNRKDNNLKGKIFSKKVERDLFQDWLVDNALLVQFVFHIGARTDTTEFDYEILRRLNLDYSKKLWEICRLEGIPFVYASSAATYGLGENGFSDKESILENLKPLNPYGVSKNEFDKWALAQKNTKDFFWVGLKFFNVFGPNEYHKGRMASVVFHAYNQIANTQKMKLFASHNPKYADGEQVRDFIYVKDVVNVLFYFLHNRNKSGIYNLGTGIARTFNDLVNAVFASLQLQPNIEYIETPLDIRDKYQYYTCADMNKLKESGFALPFYTLEEGVNDYVCNYLKTNKYY